MRAQSLVLLLAMTLSAATAGAQPDVNGVEGAARPGETFRLFGGGFGAKAHPGPLRWDDFQNGTLGARLTDHADGGVFDLQAAIDRLGMNQEQFFCNLDRYGNTSGASVGIALDEAVREGRLKEGDHALMVVFGAGFTWGSADLDW